jgi:glycine betaine catabolism B
MPVEIEAKVKEVIQRTYNVKSVRVEVSGPIDFKAGQFLAVMLKAGPEYKHYLSFSNSPTEKGYIEFTKKISPSVFSQAFDALKPGDMINIQYPMGKFVLDQTVKKIAFISGGIGITPIRSVIKFAVDLKLDIDIVLLYSNRTIKDIAFLKDFEELQKVYNKLKVVHVLCERPENFNCVNGVINADIIKDQVRDYAERKFYLCGPPPMVEAMKKILSQELKLPEAQIITENFQGY